MKSGINKKKIDKIINHINKHVGYNVVQFADGKYFISNGDCIWIDHNVEYLDEDRCLVNGKEESIEKYDIESLSKNVITDFLDNADIEYYKAEKIEKGLAVGKQKIKGIVLNKDDFWQVIQEKYYNTFSKDCKYLISKDSLIVFVTDKDDLLIGIIMALKYDHLEMK